MKNVLFSSKDLKFLKKGPKISTICSNKTYQSEENYPLHPLWIFEFLDLETQKVCKNILKRRNFLKKKISSEKNEKLHLFQALENWTFSDFGDFGLKNAKKPQNGHFSSEKIRVRNASKCNKKLFFEFLKQFRCLFIP